jgi:hypothetical protein
MAAITPQQKEYIRNSYIYKTDDELGSELGVSRTAVKKFRHKEKLIKPKGRSQQLVQSDGNEYKELVLRRRLEQEFKKGKYYKALKPSYTEEELDFYFEKLLGYIADVERVGEEFLYAERIALDNLIQTEIRINRYTKMEKILNDNLYLDITTEEKEVIRRELMGISREIRGLQDSFEKQQTSLELTKKEKSKKKQNTKISIITLLEEMKSAKSKKGISVFSSLSEKSVRNVMEEWRKNGILIDENTESSAINIEEI